MKKKNHTLALPSHLEKTLRKNKTYSFLLLYICVMISSGVTAQKLSLVVTAEQEIAKELIDSLHIKPHYPDKEAVYQKTDSIQAFFQQIGFIDSKLIAVRQKNDSTYTAAYYLGKRHSRIIISHPPYEFSEKEIKKIGERISDSEFSIPVQAVPETLLKLTELQNKRGSAFARLYLSKIEKRDSGQLSAKLKIQKGRMRTIDSIVIRGYENFPESFIKYFAGIRKGRVFDRGRLLAQHENLNSLNFVRTSKPPEVLFRDEATIVYLYLEKANNNHFDGILGFATDEDTQKLTVNGYLDLRLNNNLNYGEEFHLNYRADGNEQLEFNAALDLPYLLKTPFGLQTELRIFKRDSSFITTDQQLKATYQFSPAMSGFLGYKGQKSSNLLDQAVAGTPIEDYKSRFLLAGAAYKKNQASIVFPVKSSVVLDLGIGKRRRESDRENQFRGTLNASTIFNLDTKNSIYVRNKTAVLFSKNYLANELFQLGGINSIRGFDENSIDASFYSVLNTEYRHQFSDLIYVNTIIDLGYFENQTFSQTEQLYSFGFGLGLFSKAGLFRFIVANGASGGQNLSFSNTKVHIGITSKF